MGLGAFSQQMLHDLFLHCAGPACTAELVLLWDGVLKDSQLLKLPP